MSNVATEMVEGRLNQVEAEIKSKVGNLAEEKDELQAALKKLKRGTKGPGEPPATSDKELIDAVKAASSENGPASSSKVAEVLGVDVRTISRRLAKKGTE